VQLSFHYEALKLLGGAFLLLLVVIVFFSPWTGELLSRLLDRAIDKVQPIGTTKEEREQARRNRRRFKLEGKTQLRAFKWFCGVGATFLFLNLILPASYFYRLPNDWFRPLLVTGMAAGFLVIFIGPGYFGERRGWAQWTFWVSLLSALIPIWEISHLWQPRRRGGMVLLWMMGIILFFLVFDALRRIEAHERRLKHPDP
jgi:hypothetical protein